MTLPYHPLPEGATDDEYDFDVAAEIVAKQRGQEVVYPEQNQLQLDFDKEDPFQRLQALLDAFDMSPHVDIRTSRSGLPHRHITLTFHDRIFTESERISYQFAFGSDPVRERLNLMRHELGIKRPTRLFK